VDRASSAHRKASNWAVYFQSLDTATKGAPLRRVLHVLADMRAAEAGGGVEESQQNVDARLRHPAILDMFPEFQRKAVLLQRIDDCDIAQERDASDKIKVDYCLVDTKGQAAPEDFKRRQLERAFRGKDNK
jgi:hypothetical protein